MRLSLPGPFERALRLSRFGDWHDGLRWYVANRVGLPELTVSPYGQALLIRTGSPDDLVAVDSLGTEFSELLQAVPKLRYPFIVDAGGYIGTAAIALARAYPHALVVSLEPSTENFQILRYNTARFANIVALNKALAPTPGRLTLNNRDTGQWGFTLVEKPQDFPATPLEEVECVTLEQLLQEFRADGIGVLKLDIEGGEQRLFSHPVEWLARTQALCIELHDRIVPGCSSLYQQVTLGRDNRKLHGEKYLSLRPSLNGLPGEHPIEDAGERGDLAGREVLTANRAVGSGV